MTPEEKKFNSDLLYVLSQIKKKSLYTLKGKPIEYCVDLTIVVVGGKLPTAEEETQILEKLQEIGTIKIIKRETNSLSVLYAEREYYALEIIEPKFSELYEELRKPFKKFEKHKQSSAQSLKKILGILELLKEEWELMPKNLQGDYNYRVRRYEGIEAQISHQTTAGWVRKCGLNDSYQLNSILDTLLEDGLILKADFRSEYA